MCCFISFIRRANLDIWRCEFRGEALKQLPISFSTGAKASLILTGSIMLNIIGR
jgi:hypothetical protein